MCFVLCVILLQFHVFCVIMCRAGENVSLVFQKNLNHWDMNTPVRHTGCPVAAVSYSVHALMQLVHIKLALIHV